MHKIRKGDRVIVMVGKDIGKIGVIESMQPKRNQAIVSGVNVYKKAMKPNPQAGVEGGLKDKTMPINVSNLAIYNPKTKKGDRVGFRWNSEKIKERFYKKTGQVIRII